MRLEGADEDVAWEEGLEVDQAVRMGSCEEDLEYSENELCSHSNCAFFLSPIEK